MKKKKLGRVFRYVGIAILLCIAIFMSIIACRKETKALEPVPNYNIYTYIAECENVSTSGDIIEIFFTNSRVYYYYDNGNYSDDSYHLAHYSFYFDVNELQYEVDPILKIDISEIDTGAILLFGGFDDIANDSFYIDRITTLQRYFDKITDSAYSDGYVAASDTSNPLSPYNQGLARGEEIGRNSISGDLQSQAEYYQGVIDSLNSDISHYQQLINSGSTAWGSFQSLLGTIFLFPIKFFKEGFDVNIFGVNVGGLIVGIGMLGITFAIVGLILGRRGGK